MGTQKDSKCPLATITILELTDLSKQDTVPGNQSAMYAATQNAIREEFISKTPASEFSDWCRFTDKYPWFLDVRNDGVLYVNADIKAQE